MTLNYIQYFFETAWALSISLTVYYWLIKKHTSPLFRIQYLTLTSLVGVLLPILLNIQTSTDLLDTARIPQMLGSLREWGEDRLETWAPGISISTFDLWLLIHFFGFSAYAFRMMDRFWPLRTYFTHTAGQGAAYTARPASLLASWYWYPEHTAFSRSPDSPVFKFRHSLEVIWVEGLVAAQWFNPLVYWYKQEWKLVTLSQIRSNPALAKPAATTPWQKWSVLFFFLWLPFFFNPFNNLRNLSHSWLAQLNQPILQVADSPEPVWDFSSFDGLPDRRQSISDSTFQLVWGNLTVNLGKNANPNVYGAYHDVALNELLNNLDANIKIKENKKAIPIKSLQINKYRIKRSNTRSWEGVVADTLARLSNRRDIQEIKESLKEGDVLSLSGETDGIQISMVHFRIKTAVVIFEPLTRVLESDPDSPLFGFQVLTRAGFKTRLKIDTSRQETRHILPLYADTSRFEVIHVPDFQTRHRLLNYADNSPFLLAAQDDQLDYWFYMDRLREFHPPDSRQVHLQWGNLFAKPESEIYSYEDFLEARDQDIQLMVGDSLWAMQQFAVLIYPSQGMPTVEIFQPGQGNLRNLLQSVQPQTSIKISGIQVEAEGQSLYFAPEFAFHIGASRQHQNWQVEVHATANPERLGPRRSVRDNVIEFERFPLNSLIAELLGQRLSRLEFEGLSDPPLVNVRFEAPGISEDLAYSFMLDELQKKYRFTIHRDRLPRNHWRMQVADPQQLEKARYSEPEFSYEKLRPLQDNGYHLLTGINLYELCDYLEDRFDLIFELYPNQYMSESFIMGLDFSSFEELKAQLEQDYGLQLIDADWLWNGYIIRF